MIENQVTDTPEKWKIVRFHTSAGTGTIATATIELTDENEKIHCDAATGDGPVDAVFRALERISGIPGVLEQYHVGSVSSGKDAQGEVRVEVRIKGELFTGRSVSTDIIESSAKAYLQAINKAIALQES